MILQTAQLNVIAPYISNFYLASYGLVNISTFHVALVRPIGWRPAFRFYNKWLSLVGFFLSLAAMFLSSWPAAVVTLCLVFGLLLFVKYFDPRNTSAPASALAVYLIRCGIICCRGQLGIFARSADVQDGPHHGPAVEHDRGPRQDVFAPGAGHDGPARLPPVSRRLCLPLLQKQFAHGLRRHRQGNRSIFFHPP